MRTTSTLALTSALLCVGALASADVAYRAPRDMNFRRSDRNSYFTRRATRVSSHSADGRNWGSGNVVSGVGMATLRVRAVGRAVEAGVGHTLRFMGARRTGTRLLAHANRALKSRWRTVFKSRTATHVNNTAVGYNTYQRAGLMGLEPLETQLIEYGYTAEYNPPGAAKSEHPWLQTEVFFHATGKQLVVSPDTHGQPVARWYTRQGEHTTKQ